MMTSRTVKFASRFVFTMLIVWPGSTVRRTCAVQAVGQTPIVHSGKFVERAQRNLLESVKKAVTLVMIAQSDRNAKMEHVRTLALGSLSVVQTPNV